MSSVEKNITHDHIYSSNFEIKKDDNQITDSLNKKTNLSNVHCRIIRQKCDIQTEEDREEYIRRRTLNNVSCRISRIHRRSKLDFIIKKCTEYEDLNTKLKLKSSVMTQVINQLKEHLRTLVPNNIKEN